MIVHGFSSLDKLEAQKIESLKAGISAGLSFFLAYLLLILFNHLLLSEKWQIFAPLHLNINIMLVVRLAIAFVSGFLFGVTYRYIIRNDQNSHLKDGAVLAFGLVRGVAPVEISTNLTENLWLLVILGLESIICFAISRFTLDLILQRSWLKPFNF